MLGLLLLQPLSGVWRAVTVGKGDFYFFFLQPGVICGVPCLGEKKKKKKAVIYRMPPASWRRYASADLQDIFLVVGGRRSPVLQFCM